MPQTLTHVSKYRIERELGRGAMGVVYKAFDPVVERMVAIKTIRLDVENAEDLVTRLRREAKSVGQLEHPNIVTLYDAGETGGLFYLAMQFIQGETLQDRLARQRWFTLREVQDFFRQICAGLDYAHQHGVIHRDIKPANIMITTEGVVKLTDFGIAKLAAAGTTSTGLIVGTPSYMSPEQALGRPLDGRSDIFSLGSILYELITGEKAFPGQNTTTVMYKIVHEAPTPLHAMQPGLDPAVEAIVLKALGKGPDERFQTCSELSTALELYLNKAVASIPKTSVAVVAPSPPLAAAVPSLPPTPTPFPAPVAPGSFAGVPPVAGPAPAPGTVTQTLPGQTGMPLAWVGGGVLGTLLLVLIIMLLLQMRRPAPVTAPVSPPVVSSPQAPPSATVTQPAGPAQATSPPTQPVAPESPPLVPRSLTPAKSGVAQRSRQVVASRETKPLARPPAQEVRPSPSQTVSVSAATSRPQATSPPPAIPAGPESFKSLLLKGDLAFQSSRYNEALGAYSEAYRLNPNSREVRRKIALVLTLLGRAEEAQKYK